MIRTDSEKQRAALSRLRQSNMPLYAGVGILASLVVAVWGSFFAMKNLYPAYVTAFQPIATAAPVARAAKPAPTPDEIPVVEAAIAPVVAAAPVDADATVVPFAASDATEDAPLPETFARLSEDDAERRAGASLFGTEEKASATAAETDLPTISEERLGTGPIEDEGASTRVASAAQHAIAGLPRPAPRPASALLPSMPAPFDHDANATVDPEMGTASALAVQTSPRPRSVPSGLREMAIAARDRTPTANGNDTPDAILASLSTEVGAVTQRSQASGKGCGRNHASSMPNRKGNAQSGRAFLASVGNGSGSSRDNAIIAQLARGNMPGFLHDLEPVVLRGRDSRGASTEIVVCVTSDYLSVGSDQDFVRVPLGLPAASSIAGTFDMMLPTARIVDAIYAQAPVKLSPKPMQAGPQMSSTDYFLRHNATIEDQRRGRAGLIAGHKKDVVVANRMASNPGRVAIYGWHRSNGDPIQPVSTVHGASYADYSHGIRLVSRTAYLNGKAVDLETLLSSNRYAYLLNNDGPLPAPVIQIASR